MSRISCIAVVTAIALASCESAPQDPSGPLPAHHTADGHFRNTDAGDQPMTGPGSPKFRDVKFATFYPLPIVTGGEELWADDAGASATWIGHSTFYLRLYGTGILTDPLFSERASPVSFAGPRRATAPGRALDSLPKVDLVIISHSHYDHLDKPSIRAIHKKWPAAQFIVPLGIKKLIGGWGIPGSLVQERDWWESVAVGSTRLTCVPAHHSNQRTIFQSGKNSTLWAGWVIEQAGKRIWFAGDIAMGSGAYYRAMAERFAPLDLCLIPIGAYYPEKVFGHMHVSPTEAVDLHVLMQSRASIGMHWGTFALTGEGTEVPRDELKRICSERGITTFTTMQHGEIRAMFR